MGRRRRRGRRRDITENKMDHKIELCKKIEKIVGHLPPGLGDILSILRHPDVIELTFKFLNDKHNQSKKEDDPTIILARCLDIHRSTRHDI